jgi:hypothetical protein
MNGRIHIGKTFLVLLIVAIFLSGCENATDNGDANNSSIAQPACTAQNNYEEQDRPHIVSFVPQIITYNGNHMSAWLKQFILVQGGDIKEGSLDKTSKTNIILSYEKDNAIKTIDLTSYALKYNLFQGVDYITASPAQGKYIVVEFSSDIPISFIVNTITNESKILWYDESTKESMMKISFNPDNDEEFAFLPSVEIEGPNGSHSVKLYNMDKHEITTIGEVPDPRIIMQQDSLIQWKKNQISVILFYENKIYNFAI